MKLSRRIRSVSESMTIAFTEKARLLQREGVEVIALTAGEPDFDTPEPIKEAAIEAIRKGYTKYTSTSGIIPLREAIREKLGRDNNLDFHTDQIIASSGAKHALFNALQVLLDEGDEAIIPAPYWTSYPDMIALTGAKPVILNAGPEAGFKITPSQLEAAITDRTRLLLFNSPSNPTGAVYSPEEIRALAEVCVAKNIFVISDEIYERFIYGDLKHASIVAAHPKMKELGVVINGVSKAYAMTGWRVGYAAGPHEIIRACDKMQGQSTSNPSSISQHAAIAALRSSPAIIKTMVAEYRKRRDMVVNRMTDIAGMNCHSPQGAFYVFPTVKDHYGKSVGGKKIENSIDWAIALLDQKAVALVPGAGFGNDECVRLSYAASTEELSRGMDGIAEFVKSLS